MYLAPKSRYYPQQGASQPLPSLQFGVGGIGCRLQVSSFLFQCCSPPQPTHILASDPRTAISTSRWSIHSCILFVGGTLRRWTRSLSSSSSRRVARMRSCSLRRSCSKAKKTGGGWAEGEAERGEARRDRSRPAKGRTKGPPRREAGRDRAHVDDRQTRLLVCLTYHAAVD